MILLVDDDTSVTASLSLLLKQAGHASRSAATPEEAVEILRGERCELVIQDMNFTRRTSGEEGLALLKQIKAAHPSTPVVLITAWGSIPLAVEGMKAGAIDFVTKPWTNQHMLQTVETVLGLSTARAQGEDAPPSRDELDGRFDFGNLLGHDPRILRVLQLIGRISATDASVLVTGESGTGKELVADAIHRNSRRSARPFVKVNLGGIATTLFESEMFGHVRGAFTDARADRKGRFEVAHGGTIFLDEIGDLDLGAQVKLLRVLQDRTYEVLGSSQKREVDVRVIAATNRNLAEMVARGEFREDLLYRINLITIHLPAVRERPDDIPLLASRFLQALGHAYGREGLTLGADARVWLQAQPWPGNVRQLRQWIERAVLVTTRSELRVDDFRASAAMEQRDAPADPLPPVGSLTLDEVERAMIEKALKHHGRNLTRVADSLGLSRAALYRRLEKYENPDVSRRGRFIAYLAFLHLVFAALGAALLWQSWFWLIPLEIVFATSLLIAVVLTRRLFRDVGFARAGLQMLKEHDLTSKFREIGHEEIDELIRLYNRMMDGLREERTRLQEQHHFLSHILRVSPSGIVILDFDGRIANTNPASERLLGVAAAAMTGRRLAELPEPIGAELAAIVPHTSGSVTRGGRLSRCHHGTFIDRGFPRSFFLIEELTEEIRRAERGAYEKLIRVMAHEVNNSVTGANSLLHSSLIYGRELSADSRPDFERALGIVIERTDQLNRFMRRFADVFRLPPPLKKPESVLSLVEGNVRLLAARPDAAGVRWEWDVDDPSLVVPMDRGQMERAFLNILQNAVDATGSIGTITIRVRGAAGPAGPRGMVMIEDTGPGIAPEAQANLFTPFFSTKPHGQGIGLTLVREILTGHGFDHSLERAPGGPTRFTIVF